MAFATSIAILGGAQNDANGQGCIAVKPPPTSSIANPLMLNRDVVPRLKRQAVETHDGKKAMLDESYSSGYTDKRWTATVGYRWFTSDRHFSGDVEQKQRQQLDTQVENDVHAIDASISYAFTTRFSGTLTIPYSFSERSSLY